MFVTKRNGENEPLDINKIHRAVEWACEGLNASVSSVEANAHIKFLDGIKTTDIQWSLIQSALEQVDVDSEDYTFVAARLLLQSIYKEANNGTTIYGPIRQYLKCGVDFSNLSSSLLYGFDFARLDAAIVPERDLQFRYLGIKTLYDRYLIRAFPTGTQVQGDLLEMPQHFWMRVAMGLALQEQCDVQERTDWAIKFYEVMSKFEYIPSTPTLFNSGTKHSQMSSCYLMTVSDSIWERSSDPIGQGIFASMTEAAMLSKFSGGIGADWSRVRAAGSHIRSTNGKSSGIIPYLKVFNDTSVAVNQGGKRKGAFAAYLEPWHADIQAFIDIKKAHGDELMRARDIFTALWINDVFMERVRDNGKWSLFCPSKVPQLTETYGEEFRNVYEKAENEGIYEVQIDAAVLWRKIIEALVESGGPWITFKDEANLRYNNHHAGIIRSSNLCTEIMEHSSDSETAVCNLGSLNFAVLEEIDLQRVVPIAMRMLDNVIDLNFYPTGKSENSNLKYRPVGLGVMGWMDYLVRHEIDFESIEHLQITDKIFGLISMCAIDASADLAQERGAYLGYEGSAWSEGFFPIDTAKNLDVSWYSKTGRDLVNCVAPDIRNKVAKYGVRNGLMLAIAPTATIANIVGTTQSIEPIHSRVYEERNMSGKFKVVDTAMRHGKPEFCKEAFDIDQTWIIKAAAIRQRWLDQSQSVNLFRKATTRGRELSEWYFMAWELGLKSTYYLRNRIVQVEDVIKTNHEPVQMCSIDNPDCESCQ